MAISVDLDGCTQSPFSLLNLDVLKTLCDAVELSSPGQSAIKALDGLSRTNHVLRNLCLPSVLRVVHVRGDWDHAMAKVGEMLEYSELGSYVKTFNFVLPVLNEAEHTPHEPLAPALAGRFARLQRIEKLVLVIPQHQTDTFGIEIAKAGFRLPIVRTLVVGPYCDFAISLCSNVDTISSNGWTWLHARKGDLPAHTHTRRLLAAASEVAATVTRLEMMEGWTVDLVEALHDALPNLKKLSLDGGSYRRGIKAFIPLLSRFGDLEYLALADASSLGVGFEPPRCGNIYRGPHGKEVRERVNRQCEEAEAEVANMVAPACAHLKELWIGERTKVEVLSDEQGGFRNILMHRNGKREQVVYYPGP